MLNHYPTDHNHTAQANFNDTRNEDKYQKPCTSMVFLTDVNSEEAVTLFKPDVVVVTIPPSELKI